MRLAERLRAALTGSGHDAELLLEDDRGDVLAPEEALIGAAVLVPIVDRPEPTLLLTLRTETLRRHAGQVAFPGGRIDPEDADAIAAALREADEEIGLPRDAVEIIGVAERYRTVTGYEITPVIGVVPPDLPLVPHEIEVAAVFEVPLDFVFAPANQVRQAMEWRGAMRHYYEIMWGERRIWGVTAALIVNLSRRLAQAG
jgi:8-oxo-dGTP pyrophosphatase MutT (NUDIX family)